MTKRGHSRPNAKESIFVAKVSARTSVHADSPGAFEEDVMPFETAAKAIFVKANGLSAYWKTTGLVPHGKKF